MRTARLFVLVLTALALLLTPAWTSAAIKFDRIQYDSPGTDDGSNSSLNAEYVVIENTGNKAVNVTGWTIMDKAGHKYTFDSFKLGAGKSVIVHTGKGSDTRRNKYWGSGAYIWNNDGDTATLRRDNGKVADTCKYAGGGTSVNC